MGRQTQSDDATEELPPATEPSSSHTEGRPNFRIGESAAEMVFVEAWTERGNLYVDIGPATAGEGTIESYRGAEMSSEQIVENIHEQYSDADTVKDIEYEPLREQIVAVFGGGDR